MNRETILRITLLTGALQATEKLIAALDQQAATLRGQIDELKRGGQ